MEHGSPYMKREKSELMSTLKVLLYLCGGEKKKKKKRFTHAGASEQVT